MLSNIKIKTELFINRFFNKTYVPHPRDVIFVDPTGLCNLGCKFCAYPKLEHGFTMGVSLFEKIINEAADMGFKDFFVTPMLGDAFMDKTIYEKLSYIENHKKTEAFSFYTNFVLAKNLEKLFSFKKLKYFEVSVYGINDEDFTFVTTKNKSQFNLFLNNLRELRELVKKGQVSSNLHFSIRTKMNEHILKLNKKERVEYMLSQDGEVVEILNDLKSVARISVATLTDTWLGVVTQEDVAPLGLTIQRAGPMNGPCNLLFGAIQIRYDGTVHGCTRSVANKLMIGDITKNSLDYILSYKNPKYKGLIESQLKNKFNNACQECAHYRSIYQNFESGAGKYGKNLSLKQALKLIS
ncbi:radical SAM protein [Alphaproteobacteria bacterium]|nr:radical SAM protein [Alphaproteobacteria bacterium]